VPVLVEVPRSAYREQVQQANSFTHPPFLFFCFSLIILTTRAMAGRPPTPPPAYTPPLAGPSSSSIASSVPARPPPPTADSYFGNIPVIPKVHRGYGPTPIDAGGHLIPGGREPGDLYRGSDNGGITPGGRRYVVTMGAPTPPPTQYMQSMAQMQARLLPVPYYDPTSPHSVMLARSRARWRFFEVRIT
jgi:hypothetical protein